MIFNWLWKRKPQGLCPECLWSVVTKDDGLRVTDPNRVVSVALSDLQVVLVETNDSGPWGADFWWILDSGSGAMASFPQGATGEVAAIQLLESLPGFDFEKLGQAARSTTNALFVVWKRQAQ